MALQPIGTAPRDGTTIIGHDQEWGFYPCRWWTREELAEVGYEGEEHGWYEGDDIDGERVEPTHWKQSEESQS